MVPYREFFETRLDRLEDHLKTMLAERRDAENND
jgi:hypothetical protein